MIFSNFVLDLFSRKIYGFQKAKNTFQTSTTHSYKTCIQKSSTLSAKTSVEFPNVLIYIYDPKMKIRLLERNRCILRGLFRSKCFELPSSNLYEYINICVHICMYVRAYVEWRIKLRVCSSIEKDGLNQSNSCSSVCVCCTYFFLSVLFVSNEFLPYTQYT